jgi:hypothetical protein
MSAERPDLLLRDSLFGVPFTVALRWMLCDGSILHAVMALAASRVILMSTTLALALRRVHGRWREFAAPLLRPWAGTAIMVAVILGSTVAMTEAAVMLRLIVASVVCAVVYIVYSPLVNRAVLSDLRQTASP